MDFNAHKPIYLQICDQICDRILNGELKPEDRIRSVRELGAALGVNPNTIMRSYEQLQNDGIIYNKRDIGYFIAENAEETVMETKRKQFIDESIPELAKKMQLLRISDKALLELLEQHHARQSKE